MRFPRRGSSQVAARAPTEFVVTVLGIVAALAFVAVGVTSGGSTKPPKQPTGSAPTSASPASQAATTSTTVALPPTTATTSALSGTELLAAIGVRPGDLGAGWVDQGFETSSADLTNPPQPCAPYLAAFNARDAASTHQYIYNFHGGYNDGGMASTVVESAPATVAAQMRGVRARPFTGCAEATAKAWLLTTDDQASVNAETATPIILLPGSDIVAWRIVLKYVDAIGPGDFTMDVVYIGAGNRLAKIGVARCSCLDGVTGTVAILPDELLALSAVKDRITEPARQLPALTDNADAEDPSTSTGPCQLLTVEQVTALIGPAGSPAAFTLSDDASECTWLAGTESLALESGDTPRQFESRLRDTGQALGGLGVQAATSPIFPGKILVRKGDIWVEVFVEGTSDPHTDALNTARSILGEL